MVRTEEERRRIAGMKLITGDVSWNGEKAMVKSNSWCEVSKEHVNMCLW